MIKSRKRYLLSIIMLLVLSLGLMACNGGSYTVSFIVEGEVWSTVDNVKNGKKVSEPTEIPVSSDYDYIFDGWYEEAAAIRLWDFAEKEITEDTSIYAGFRKTDYTVDDLDTKFTDELKLIPSFAGKKFLTSGIEEVRLANSIDGDTSHFFDGSNNLIKIRYLGINTPESTSRIDPWGKQASEFVKNRLESAYSIVIEAEILGGIPETDTTGDRYLGYVWYKETETDDYRLLNLEVIENCFSHFTGNASNLKYGPTLRDAYIDKSKMGLRVFGEKDPLFNYDNVLYEITIGDLKNDYGRYSNGSKLKFKVVVARKVGNSLYVQDLEKQMNDVLGTEVYNGIYVYHSFASGLSTLKPGDVIEFEAQASFEGDYGAQLVNPAKLKLLGKEEYNVIELDEQVTFLESYEGMVVKAVNVKIIAKHRAETGAYTITGELANGSEVQIRVDKDAGPKVPFENIVIGEYYNVIGGVSKYINTYENNKLYYQIMLGNLKDDGIGDFRKSNN